MIVNFGSRPRNLPNWILIGLMLSVICCNQPEESSNTVTEVTVGVVEVVPTKVVRRTEAASQAKPPTQIPASRGVALGAGLTTEMMALESNTVGGTGGHQAADTKQGTEELVAELTPLPKRLGPLPHTTKQIPHEQIDVDSAPAVSKELLQLTLSLPDLRLTLEPEGSHAIYINDYVPLAHHELAVNRLLVQIHVDGSLRIVLPSKRAEEAVRQNWGVQHPSARNDERFNHHILLYTPQSKEEIETISQLIVDTYNYLTGRNARIPTFVD